MKFDWESEITTEAAVTPNSSFHYLSLGLASSPLFPTMSEHCISGEWENTWKKQRFQSVVHFQILYLLDCLIFRIRIVVLQGHYEN